jgi:2-polyprenyl-3-methyl-5-hydroxy-6-metoxy-1,4-benzoquinol methylase
MQLQLKTVDNTAPPASALAEGGPGDAIPRVARWVLRWPRVGLTDIFHTNVMRRGTLGKLYVLMFGTPNVGSFANGIYLKRVVDKMTFATALDAGCGDATFAFYLASRYPEMHVTAVDIGEQGLHTSETTLEVAQRIQRILRLPNLQLRKADLRELRIDDTFDFVYSFDVLEHIAENRLVMERIYSSLRWGGMFLLRIPTREQRRILPARFTQEHARWAAIEHVGQHHDMDNLVTDLQAIGFQITSAEYTMGFWGRLSFELSEALRYYKVPEPLLFALMPVLKVFRFIDTTTKSSDGDGLLVLCKKSRTTFNAN